MSSCGIVVGLLRSMSNFFSKQRQLLRFAAVSSQISILMTSESFHVALADIFISQLGATLGSYARSKLTIEDVLEDPTVFHTTPMAKLVHSASLEQRVHRREAGTGKNLSVGHFVPPANAKDA